MENDLARQIVDRYLKVVAGTGHIVAGVPESMLPCDQSLIKEAIKEIIRQVPEGSDEYHRLRAAYPKLATFIPDDQAKRSAEAEAAVASMDMASDGFKFLNEHAEILRKIQNQMSLLSEELYEFLGDKR